MNLNRKHKVGLAVVAAAVLGLGVAKCPVMNKHFNAAVSKVKSLNPLK